MKIRGVQSVPGEVRMSKLFRAAILFATALGLLLLNASKIFAQTFERLEAGANYNYVGSNAPPGACGCFSANGGSAWFGYNFNRNLAVVGELSSGHASNIDGTTAGLTLTSYLAGPRYSWHRRDFIVPFGQFLLGGAHASGALTPEASGLAGSENAFALMAGGGIDIEVARRVAFRAFQLDYYLTRFDNGVNHHQNNFRMSIGIVFRFGREK
jgi:outer membrane immunogenic protein